MRGGCPPCLVCIAADNSYQQCRRRCLTANKGVFRTKFSLCDIEWADWMKFVLAVIILHVRKASSALFDLHD